MSKLIHIYALFLMVVFCTSCGQNQTNGPKDTIRSEIKDIGPNVMVRNIKRGSNGTILIAGPNNASFGDVFRYDARLPEGQGKSFTNLTSKLGQHKFQDVLEDRSGNIWFATTDSGVYYYNGKSLPTGQVGIQHFTTTEGLANNRVTSIYEDKAGIIWFGTGGGVSRYDGKSFRNFTSPNAPLFYKEGDWNNDIHTIIEDKTGKLWVGTRGDAFVYDGKKFTTLTHKGEPFLDVWAIMEDRKGTIWLSGYNGFKVSQTGGLYRYDGSTFTKVSERGAYAIIEDKKGNIWTTGPVNPANWTVQALSRYEAKSLSSNEPTVTEIRSGKAFLGLSEANDGSIWFGDATGVYRYDGKTITDFYNKEGQKKYSLDTKQSVVIWKGSWLLGAWEGSTFLGDGAGTGGVDLLKGELLIESDRRSDRHLVGGAVDVDMTTIEQKFDDPGPHNKLPPFFDVKKFPVSRFIITKVETGNDGNTKVPTDGSIRVTSEGNIKVTGNLTIEGITKAVTFPAQLYFKDGMDGTVEINGTLTLDRTEWGIDSGSEKHFFKSGNAISDDVKLFMKIVAKK
ncbi:two-component regulator propeller domain-containing protein [Spirosoma pollinicola]|uniref:Transcriptional regulator n=1 Tax=Spirosoma pollinicola TaxID=2057025 RepID=A0A2K8YUR4_9BACT|nr:two-component regulator propeller domain-containing protein [Spirosoma pollinicola]AUD01372.1 transcriptional regulator [Spirosoma pollinicola]